MLYGDPYNNAKHGTLKGDKSELYFKLEFKEGKFYSIDEGFVLIADVTKYGGSIRRAFKPELDLEPGVCAIPLYDKEYELWEKDKTGKKTPVKHQPSVFEKNLHSYLQFEYLDAIDDGNKSVKGSIAFLPNDQLAGLSDNDLITQLRNNCKLELIESTGTLPEYKPFVSTYKKNGSFKLSPQDKLVWLKKELCSSIADKGCNEEMSLIDLTAQIVSEAKNDNTLAVYVDFIKTMLA